MSTMNNIQTPNSSELIMSQVLQLPPLQKIRLVEKLMRVLETELSPVPIVTMNGMIPELESRRSLYGVLAHLGKAPSAEEIDEARHEAWATFPREDV